MPVASMPSSTSRPRRTSTARSTEPEAFLHTDILGTHTLLEVVRERAIARMVQVSTDEVYGSIDEGSFCETDPLQPSSPYSAARPAATCRCSRTTSPTGCR